jgi:hypothetical protein
VAFPSTATFSTPVPAFAGATRHLADRRWVSPQTLQALLAVSPSPYVGRLPAPVVRSLLAAGVAPRQAFEALDALAAALQGVRAVPGLSLTARLGGPTGPPLTLAPVGNGAFGSVYRLTLADQVLALKCYFEVDHITGSHGPWGESAAALYWSRTRFRDLSQYHFGNPQAGWGVFEFIDPDTPPTRPRSGPSIYEQPVSLTDCGGENQINGIQVDYGGIVKRSDTVSKGLRLHVPDPGSPEAFDRLANPQGMAPRSQLAAQTHQAQALRAARHIPDQPLSDRPAAFQAAWATGLPSVQAEAAAHLGCLPQGTQLAAFTQAMATGEPTVQREAACQLQFLFEPIRLAALRRALSAEDPAVRGAAISQLDSLPPTAQQSGFALALTDPDPGNRARAIRRLEWLNPTVRPDAFQLALTQDSPAGLSLLVEALDSLPADQSAEGLAQLGRRLAERLTQTTPRTDRLHGLTVTVTPPADPKGA